MFTARQLVVHIAEGERGWMDHIVDGGPYVEWVTEHEDPARGWELLCDAPDHAALLTMLEEWHRPTQRWLAKPASELSRVITSRGPDGAPRNHTLHWVLDHVQEHEIHHRTQLGLYLRLMGIAPPSL
jgi:uncharacterized damage-inducible protein DinB